MAALQLIMQLPNVGGVACLAYMCKSTTDQCEVFFIQCFQDRANTSECAKLTVNVPQSERHICSSVPITGVFILHLFQMGRMRSRGIPRELDARSFTSFTSCRQSSHLSALKLPFLPHSTQGCDDRCCGLLDKLYETRGKRLGLEIGEIGGQQEHVDGVREVEVDEGCVLFLL